MQVETIQHCGLKDVKVAVVTVASGVLTKLGAHDGLGLSTGKALSPKAPGQPGVTAGLSADDFKHQTVTPRRSACSIPSRS